MEMNNIYTAAFSEAFAESNPYEYKQKYTSNKGKQRDSSNETLSTKKVKPSHCRVGRDLKRMGVGIDETRANHNTNGRARRYCP